MATRKVVYDDRDSIIQYNGEWFEKFGALEEDIGNFGSPYLRTLHGTSHDASISFEFDGTGVEVFGSNIVDNPTTDPDPSFDCFIDDINKGRKPPSEFQENNWILCEIDGLSAGQHKLRIDIKVKSPDQTFWLDKIQYVPSPSVPLDNKTIRIENTDSAILLDSTWGAFGPSNGTSTTKAVARVHYIGTSLFWFGYFPTEFPHGSASGTFSVDGGQPKEFPLKGLSGSTDISEYNQFFFMTPEVEIGSHTVTVTFLGSGDTTPLTLDYLYIKNGTVIATNTSTSTLSPNAPTTSVPVNAGGVSRLNVGALLGGVLGGLGFLILIAGVFLYLRRRRSSQKSMVLPFHPYSALPTSFGSNGAPTSNTMAQAASGNVALLENRLSEKRRELFRAGAQPVASSHYVSQRPGSSSWQRTGTSRTGDSSGMVHTDSGIRLNRALDDEIPPHYTIE